MLIKNPIMMIMMRGEGVTGLRGDVDKRWVSIFSSRGCLVHWSRTVIAIFIAILVKKHKRNYSVKLF